MKIMLVDDSTTMRNIQKKILSGMGHTEIAEAADGLQALAAFGAERPGRRSPGGVEPLSLP